MAKITLEIDDKNLPTVLNILKNLKTGLIKNIDTEKRVNIKPVSSSISDEGNKRYLSKDKYKQKLQQRPLEDEFLPKTRSSSRYLSKEEFKKRVKGK